MNSLFEKQGHRAHDWFDEHADVWVEHGLVTSDQIEAIREYEHLGGDTEPRISLGAELAVYLGSVIALMSGGIMVGQSWDTLATGARVALGLALATLGFVAGARLAGLDDAPTRRLASFLWLIGTGGLALTAASFVDRAEFDPGWNLVIIGTPVLVAGAALWRNRERPLQVVTSGVGAGLVLGGIGALLSIPPWIGGTIVWSMAIGIGALALTDRLRPELYVLGVAAVAAMIGALMLIDVSEVVGTSAATVTAAGIVAIGLDRHLVPILVIGVLAFLQALQGLLLATVSGAAASMVVAVAGLIAVVVAIARTTRAKTPPTS
jgi:hypothetical protein